jgi:FkbM family methyltransferase
LSESKRKKQNVSKLFQGKLAIEVASQSFEKEEICRISKRGRTAEFVVRSGTSDRKSLEETWDRGSYEKPRLGFVVGTEKWLDGGANIGGFSRLVLESGGSVIAYEPEPNNFAQLQRNAKLAICRQACLGLSSGEIALNVQPKGLQQRRHSAVFARRGSVQLLVPQHSVDSVFREVDAAKLNIEGSEIAILSSYPNLHGLQKLVCEWSFDVDNKISTLKYVLEWLETQFVNVRTSRKIVGEVWAWYPPNVFVYAWGRR